jgi:hypothetical protein
LMRTSCRVLSSIRLPLRAPLATSFLLKASIS